MAGLIIAAFVLGEVLGIVVMAVLSGRIDRWLDMKEKEKRR